MESLYFKNMLPINVVIHKSNKKIKSENILE